MKFWQSRTQSLITPAALLLLAILGVALAVRLWGVTYRLPYVGGGHSTDEPVYMDQAILLLRGDPAAVELGIGKLLGYMLAGLGKIVFGLRHIDPMHLATHAETVANNRVTACCIGIPSAYVEFYLWARVASVLAGVLSVWLVYLIGAELKSKIVGLTAALWLALLPLHVLHSHFVVRATPGLLALLVAFYVILVGYKRDNWLVLAGLGGLAIWIAVLVKQNNLILLTPFGLALGLTAWRDFGRRPLRQNLAWPGVVLIGLVAVVGLGKLFGIFDVVRLVEQLFNRIFDNDYVYQGNLFGAVAQTGWEWIIAYTRNESYALPVLLLSLPGVVVALRLPRFQGWLLLAVPVPYLLLMSFFTVRFHQWLLPPYAFMLILSALCAEALFQWLARRLAGGRHWLLAGYAILTVLLAIPSIQNIIFTNTGFSRPDARDLTSAWLVQNLPPGAAVMIDWHGPFLPQTQHQVTYVRSITDQDLAQYQVAGVQYLVGNSQNLAGTIIARTDSQIQPEVEQQLLRANFLLTQMPYEQEFQDAFGIIVRVYKIQ